MVRKIQRRKVRKNRSRRNIARGKANTFSVPGPSMQKVVRIPRMRRSPLNFNGFKGLSDNGLAFLKCAFASPDFSVDPGKGIPDQFHGRTLSIKDCFTTSLSFTPNTDTYIIVAPVPGFAYFTAEVPVGADPINFLGTPFPSYTTNFGDGTDSHNRFSKFRYASMAAGLYPTSNMMQFSGSIQVWRVDLNLAEQLLPFVSAPPATSNELNVVNKRIQGMQGIVALAPRDNYSESFIKGAYTFAFDKSQDFTWQDFCSASEYRQSGGTDTTVIKRLYTTSPDGFRLTGLGNVNTLVFKVSTPTSAVNTAMFRMWNCIELQPDTNSALFQFSGVSPPHDCVALEIYHNLKMRFPVALPCSENAKFWETVLRAIKEISLIGKLIPGPLGLISGGVNTIAETIHGLL